MSIDTTFKPISPLTFIGTTPRQVVTAGQNQSGAISFRVKSLAASGTDQYFTWGQSNAVTAGAAPTDNVPTVNTIGMLGASVETFELPAGSWFVASSATGFQFVAGTGQ